MQPPSCSVSAGRLAITANRWWENACSAATTAAGWEAQRLRHPGAARGPRSQRSGSARLPVVGAANSHWLCSSGRASSATAPFRGPSTPEVCCTAPGTSALRTLPGQGLLPEEVRCLLLASVPPVELVLQDLAAGGEGGGATRGIPFAALSAALLPPVFRERHIRALARVTRRRARVPDVR